MDLLKWLISQKLSLKGISKNKLKQIPSSVGQKKSEVEKQTSS